MKTQLKINIVTLLLIFPLSLYAQDKTEAAGRFDREKTELTKLELELEEKTKSAALAGQKAQRSADANKEAAGKLKSNLQDEGVSKAASEAARSAVRDSKQAGKANLQLAHLKKEIQQKRDKITQTEQQLSVIKEQVPAQPAGIAEADTVSSVSSPASQRIAAPANEPVSKTSTEPAPVAAPMKGAEIPV